MTADRVPFVDLRANHDSCRREIEEALARTIDRSAFILGPEVEGFEREFGAYLGVAHAIGVSSGTDALLLALRALGIGPGDEVIVPAWSFIASANAVLLAGARPVFADIDPLTYHLDPASLGRHITVRTRAIVPVHLYGQAMDLEPVLALARAHGLKVIEDACQAHGARLPGSHLRAGAAGEVGCFSFYPSKNLGGMGDGGMVVTHDPALAEAVRRLRNHGGTAKYQHLELGTTARLDGLQAAVLRVKLPRLDGWNQARRLAAARYHEGLQGLPLGLPLAAPGRDHVYHVYVVRSSRRDALLAHLDAAGVSSVIHYPGAIHEQPAYAALRPAPGTLPRSEAAGREVLSLPLYPEIAPAQQDRVIAAIRDFHR